jgi:hypothetical protein
MASGLDMMLKALGIDPQEIQRSMTETVSRLQDGINQINTHLRTIARNQEIVNARLERLEMHLGVSVPNETETEITPLKRIANQ